MPLPLVPLAGTALKIGGVALAAWFVTRHVQLARIDQRAEDALDDLPDGLAARHVADREQANMTGRLRRTIRLARSGRAIEIDAAFMARLRTRRV
ncbi:hypothetical protein [Pararhodobacter sp. SW119]|uniref:hypothetical protein n=1 Tax=Pararhodobacter sp. SW119 TaxID=2780075 RepID=UPI001ADF6308|nr:hypothetical protein [Pararhodobacter sp. SW119]